MTYDKAINYLKDLNETHPKAFKLHTFYRGVDDDTGEAIYLFDFEAKLPFTKRSVVVTFDMSVWDDKTLVETLTDKIDNMILASDYSELKEMLVRNDGLLTINWSLYKAGFEFYLKNLKLTDISTFFDKSDYISNPSDLVSEQYVLAEINSLVTTPVYHFSNFDDFVTEINCLPSRAKNYCNKHIVSNFSKDDTFTFTTSFMDRPGYSIVQVTKMNGESFEFTTKYLAHLMPYVEPEHNTTNTLFDL